MPDFQDLDGHIVKAKWIEVPLLEPKCVLMIFGEELEVRIESHILVDFGTLDEFWASTF